MWKLTENISQKNSEVLQQPINVFLVTNIVGENISTVTGGVFIVNQWHDFACDLFTTE